MTENDFKFVDKGDFVEISLKDSSDQVESTIVELYYMRPEDAKRLDDLQLELYKAKQQQSDFSAEKQLLPSF